jgi:PAS domain S-box-containing protein
MSTSARPEVPAGIFEALHQIGVAIGGVLDPTGLARLVDQHARTLVSADSVGLWLFDEQTDMLESLHFDGPRVLSGVARLRPGEGVIGLAFQTREPVVVSEYANWEHAVPLMVGGRSIGVLAVGFAEPPDATDSTVVTLSLLAAEVAPALESARLYADAQRELLERRLREEELGFQAQLLDAVEHALIVLNPDRTIRYWNRAAEKMYGWRADEVLGRPVRDIIVPETLRTQGDNIVSGLVAGESWWGEFELRRRDGSVFPALVHDAPVRDADGRVIGMIGASIDMSALVEARQSLRESEQRFRSLFEHHPDAIVAFDTAGQVVLVNPACTRLSGDSKDELLAGVRAYAPPGEYERGLAFFQAALRGAPQRFESAITHKDGHRVDVWTTQIPIVVDGEVTGVFGIAKDITERRRASQALQTSEQRFRAVWEHAADAMMLSDADGTIELVNPACCALYGLAGDELIGRSLALMLPQAGQAEAERRHRQLFSAPGPPPTQRNVVRRPDGEERVVESRAEFITRDGRRVGLITIIRDISERVGAERERDALLLELADAHKRVQEVLARVVRPDEHRARAERRAELEARVASLTPRELDVLRELASGKTNPEIGRALGLSPKAARNRVANVLAKLGVPDRTQAALVAVELGRAAPAG